jgi:hypothetical protein
MAKIIQNTTGSDILHLNSGINFPASSSITLPISLVLSVADAQTQSLLNNGAFVYNNGSSNLSASDAWVQLTANWFEST